MKAKLPESLDELEPQFLGAGRVPSKKRARRAKKLVLELNGLGMMQGYESGGGRKGALASAAEQSGLKTTAKNGGRVNSASQLLSWLDVGHGITEDNLQRLQQLVAAERETVAFFQKSGDLKVPTEAQRTAKVNQPRRGGYRIHHKVEVPVTRRMPIAAAALLSAVVTFAATAFAFMR